MADESELVELPSKRLKLSENSSSIDAASTKKTPEDNTPAEDTAKGKLFDENDEILTQKDKSDDVTIEKQQKTEKVFPIHTKAEDVGITEYVSRNKGFHGVLKQRFVDFLVNERDIKGKLVELTHTDIPPMEDVPESDNVLTIEDIGKIQSVSDSKEKSFFVTLNPDDDKEHRTLVHKAVKKLFPHLDTETVTIDGHRAVKVYRYHGNPSKKRTDKWPENRGNFCKFVLHKENKDTMEAICLLAKLVHVKSSVFSYAGTKDRRGVTSQEVTAYRVQAQRLKGLNRTLKGIILGNFEYVQDRLTLGQLSGNHFVITLRDIQGDQEDIEQAMTSLKNVGFINYYGLQRFGTAAVPTHHIGKALLLSEWSEAVKAILSPKTGKEDEFNDALQLWRETGDAAKALQILSRHKCIENTLLQGLVKHGSKDLVNALQWIPRNTRLMYIHSYQSYIWNNAVTWRIRKFGLTAVEGDLVLSEEMSSSTESSPRAESTKVPCQPLDDTEDKISTSSSMTVRMLTSEDIKSGEHTIHNVVMPLPGYDVKYPGYNAKQFYKELMDKDGIDIDNLRHRVKDYSLSGAYRRLVTKPSHTSWRFLRYNDVSEPLVLTDKDKLDGKTSLVVPSEGKFVALQIELTLPPSCYATMAVREIMKCETAPSHQAVFNK